MFVHISISEIFVYSYKNQYTENKKKRGKYGKWQNIGKKILEIAKLVDREKLYTIY